jgi:regulator of sirC expression with transglutaminase-like and TPR domain
LADTLARYRKRLLDAGFAALPDSLKAESLIRFLFDSLGLMADDRNQDLALSQPTLVLRDRRGSCVGLGLVTLALAEAVGLEALPVFLPGHLFVRLRAARDSWRNVELLRKGIARSDSFYRAEFRLYQRPWYKLTSATLEQALAALAFNLANAHAATGKTAWARAEYGRVAEQLPGFPDALGAEGSLLLAEGRVDEALAKLKASIAGDSLSFPARDAYARALQHD